MKGKVKDFLPLPVLLTPYEDLAVVAGGGEDVAVFGVRLWGSSVEGTGECGGGMARTQATHQTAPSCLIDDYIS